MKALKVFSMAVMLFSSIVSSHVVMADEPYPLEYFALREVIQNVQLSPDGKKLALIKISSKKAKPILEVYETANLSKEPYRVGADSMEITSYNWLTDSNILVAFRQKIRDEIDGFNQGAYGGKIAKLDLNKKEFKEFQEIGATVSNLLPKEPNKVILSFLPGKLKGRATSTIRPRSYYEFDVDTGTKKLLIRGKLDLFSTTFDSDGNPVFARGFETRTGYFTWMIRKPGSSKWIEIYRQHEDSFEDFRVHGYDPQNKNILFVTAHNGRDTSGLWEFDVTKKQFGELIYARNDVNTAGVRYHSNYWSNPNEIVAVRYRTDKSHYEYFDEVEGATYAQLEKLVPYAHSTFITSRSRDGNTLTVYNTGPRDPGTYYLIKDGKIQTIGSKQPLLDSDKLADVKYISWKARDGKKIHGYLTMPNAGKKPYPLIVLPHGGPFVTEVVGYDEWGQLLANNGYMVLQPQYRGSTNYGLDFYKSAFINGGQGGYKMQDDKDDGALDLVKKGLVDKDRIAMFGWSYGGYAALIAAAREDQIYQCAIAGAAVADTIQQINYYRDNPNFDGAAKIEQVKTWTESISPIKEADKVNIPLLVIHGDIDQRVPISHSRKYIKELEKHNIPHKYVELKGADHFSNTLFYNHQEELYENLIGFLKNDCGPGGL